MRPFPFSRLEAGLIPFFARLFSHPAPAEPPVTKPRSRVSVALEAAARARR